MSTNDSPDSILVHVHELIKTYGGHTAEVRALDCVSFDVARGERVALLGKSGSGKSTLLNLLGGLDQPTSGVVTVDQQNLTTMNARQLANYRRLGVGMIFQSFHLIPSKSALENVTLPLIFAGESQRDRTEKAMEALCSVGLKDRLDHRPTELSGGEQQRVAIARALINNPVLLLADEPTGNLDTGTANEILEMLLNYLREQGTTLLLVTHDEDLARRCTERSLSLRDGKLIPPE